LFQRGLEHYDTYYEKYVSYLFMYSEHSVAIARGFSRLWPFHHFSQNVQLIIINPMLASYHAELIAEIATDKNVKIYEIFTEQSTLVANDLLKSIEILKKNQLYDVNHKNFLLKYPFYALGIAGALCYLEEKNLLGVRAKTLLEKNPKHAMQVAKNYVSKRLQTIKIEGIYLGRNEDLYLSIPKLLSPHEYEDTICIALGGALINAFAENTISKLLKPLFLKRLGVYFIHRVNQTKDVLENSVLEDLCYILNYKSYLDPDRDNVKINIEKLKSEIDERFMALLDPPNPLKKYHQILSVMVRALHLIMPALESVSLVQWKKIYFYAVEKLDNYQLKDISLQFFFNHLDELKIQNKAVMNEIWIKPFKDFSAKELLNVAKLVKLFDKKYDEEKKKCLFAIQAQLSSTPEGLMVLKGLFVKNNAAKETEIITRTVVP
jgi:hypothetical protein